MLLSLAPDTIVLIFGRALSAKEYQQMLPMTSKEIERVMCSEKMTPHLWSTNGWEKIIITSVSDQQEEDGVPIEELEECTCYVHQASSMIGVGSDEWGVLDFFLKRSELDAWEGLCEFYDVTNGERPKITSDHLMGVGECDHLPYMPAIFTKAQVDALKRNTPFTEKQVFSFDPKELARLPQFQGQDRLHIVLAGLDCIYN